MYTVVKGTQVFSLVRTPWNTVLMPLLWFNTALAPVRVKGGFIAQVALKIELHFWSGDYGLNT